MFRAELRTVGMECCKHRFKSKYEQRGFAERRFVGMECRSLHAKPCFVFRRGTLHDSPALY